MARVLKDYKCAAHGFFEAYEAVCPHGCETVQQVWLTPPAIQSAKTKFTDSTLKGLASEFGMTDLRSNSAGEAQKSAPAQNPFAVQWGSPSQLGNFNLNSIRGEQVSGLNAVKGNSNLQGPKTASYIQDHENLKIDK